MARVLSLWRSIEKKSLNLRLEGRWVGTNIKIQRPFASLELARCVKALSHLTDLARRSNTGAQIVCRFSGIGTGTAAQRYHIGKNGSTSAAHRQDIGRTSATKLATAGDAQWARMQLNCAKIMFYVIIFENWGFKGNLTRRICLEYFQRCMTSS